MQRLPCATSMLAVIAHKVSKSSRCCSRQQRYNSQHSHVTCAINCADCRDYLSCAMEVVLTLLEDASVQGGPPPEGQCEVVFVTGQHGWLHQHRWVLSIAYMVTVLISRRSTTSIAKSPGNLRREVVSLSAIACAPSRILLRKCSSSLFICLQCASRPEFSTRGMRGPLG